MYNISKKYYPGLTFFGKLLILAGAYYVIAEKVMQQGHWTGIIGKAWPSGLSLPELSLLPLLLLLSALNWWLEARKWQALAASLKSISLVQAIRQSLASLTVSLLTPNRIGEYGAKALFFESHERKRVLLLNFIGNFTQMTMTLLFGILGAFFLPEIMPGLFRISPGQILVVLFVTIPVLILFVRSRIGWRLLLAWKKNLSNMPKAVLTKSMYLSFLKYLVFSHQFYLLLWLLGADLDYLQAMPIIFTMYLISSIIPGFVLFDWLVKGSVAVSLFHFLGVEEILVLSVTGLMWVLNFAIPSLIGSYFVLTFNRSSLTLGKSEIST